MAFNVFFDILVLLNLFQCEFLLLELRVLT